MMLSPTPTTPVYQNATAGQYWLVKPIAQEPAWPVFICPEDIVVEYFKSAKNRPPAARRPDGTFSKALGQSQQLLPVLYLGNLRMRWAKRIHLEQVDVESAVRERDNNPNATLVHAYVELLEQYGDSDAQYWSSRLLAKRLTEEDSGDNNEEEAVPALAQGASNGKSAEPDRLRRPYRGDESDEENLYSFVPDTKRIKIESADNTSPSSNPTPPPMSIRQSSYRSPFEATPAEQDNNNVKVEVVNWSRVKIYVDNPHAVFSVRRSTLYEKSPVLAAHTQSSAEGYYMMAPWLSDISAREFQFVVEYMNSNEYHPYIIDAGTDGVHLAGVSTIEEKREEVLKCGAVHVLARRFELPQLQALVISKLRLLQPFPAREFLAMTELAFGTGLGAEDGLDKLVVNYVVDHFYDLMRTAIDQMNEVLTAKQRLRTQVFAIMARIDEIQPLVKEESKAEGATGGDHETTATDYNTPPSVSAVRIKGQAEAAIAGSSPIFEDTADGNNTPSSDGMLRGPLAELKRPPKA